MKNRFGSALEPFVYCDLNLFEKHGDSMYRVSQADIRQSFYTLRDSLETIVPRHGLPTLPVPSRPTVMRFRRSSMRCLRDFTPSLRAETRAILQPCMRWRSSASRGICHAWIGARAASLSRAEEPGSFHRDGVERCVPFARVESQ